MLNRYKFAFTNGNFYTESGRFIESAQDSDNTLPAKSFNSAFSLTNTETPALDIILDSQVFDDEKKELLFAMIGRMLFPRGHSDDWNLGVIFAGLGGTGKSVILQHVVRKFFQPQNTIVFDGGNTVDFAQQLLSKTQPFMIVAQELHDTDAVNDLITGTPHSFQVPTVGTLCFTNQNHFMAVGETPETTTNLVVFKFNNRIKAKDIDRELQNKIEAELPAILQKSVKAYHKMVAVNGRTMTQTTSLWSSLWNAVSSLWQ